ncbi:MAG: hypothetical protein ACT4PL_11990 [Phycisphaerales bacterium]
MFDEPALHLSHTDLCDAADALFAAVIDVHRERRGDEIRVPDMLAPRAGCSGRELNTFPPRQQRAALDFLLRLGVLERREPTLPSNA